MFENVVEAFVFLDQNGDERISVVELGHGFRRMGLTGLDMKKPAGKPAGSFPAAGKPAGSFVPRILLDPTNTP